MRVCILGNGLTSLALSKALVNQNINVDLFVKKNRTKLDPHRTIGISKSNVDFFNNNIIDIDKIIWKLNKIEIFTDNLKEDKLINFEDNSNELFSVVKNFQLIDVLEKSLSKKKIFKKKYKKINLNLTKNYDLIINTDASNFINKKYFHRKMIKEHNSFAYTTIINHEKIQNDSAIQIFTKKGPLAFLPISQSETSIVFSIHNSNFQKDENVEELIHQYNFRYKIKKIKKITSFELKSLILRSYYHNNILAFGDLIHRIHPLAGQGFNMTIRDIKILLRIIMTRHDLGLSLDSSVNHEFEKKIRHNNFIFSNGIDVIHEFFSFERKIETDILSKAVHQIGKNYFINKFFKKIADRGIIL